MEKTAIVVEDDANTALALTRAVSTLGFSVRVATTLKEAQGLYRDDCPDLVLLDVTLPDGDGLDLMRENDGIDGARFVVVTGDSGQEVAVRSLRARATDFLVKPVTMAGLRSAIEKLSPAANDESTCGAQNPKTMFSTLTAAVPVDTCDRTDLLMVGESPRVRMLAQAVHQLADRNTNVVITGEAGVDKIAAAFGLHRRTPYRDIVALVQCATGNVTVGTRHVVDGFSECLGMTFTDCKDDKRVTLILDDVEQLNESRQRELLSYLTGYSIMDPQSIVKPRIICIKRGIDTSADGHGTQGELRALLPDLQLCLCQSHLEIPSLRQRVEDIAPISQKILASLNAQKKTRKILPAHTVTALQAYDWPGNMRELANVITQTFNHSDYQLEVESPLVGKENNEAMIRSVDAIVGNTFWAVEKALLQATLRSHDGNKKIAAKTLGISLKTLYNRLNAYSIEY